MTSHNEATVPTGEDCPQLTTRFLGTYTYCEGLVEDIGLAYFRQVPPEILDALLARGPWSSEIVERLLRAAVGREPLATASVPALFKKVGPGRSFDFVGEWRWATSARNDLAHSTGYAIGDSWTIVPRSARYKLRVLPSTLTPSQLWQHVDRLQALQGALMELACYLGVGERGWLGPGPAPLN